MRKRWEIEGRFIGGFARIWQHCRGFISVTRAGLGNTALDWPWNFPWPFSWTSGMCGLFGPVPAYSNFFWFPHLPSARSWAKDRWPGPAQTPALTSSCIWRGGHRCHDLRSSRWPANKNLHRVGWFRRWPSILFISRGRRIALRCNRFRRNPLRPN